MVASEFMTIFVQYPHLSECSKKTIQHDFVGKPAVRPRWSCAVRVNSANRRYAVQSQVGSKIEKRGHSARLKQVAAAQHPLLCAATCLDDSLSRIRSAARPAALYSWVRPWGPADRQLSGHQIPAAKSGRPAPLGSQPHVGRLNWCRSGHCHLAPKATNACRNHSMPPDRRKASMAPRHSRMRLIWGLKVTTNFLNADLTTWLPVSFGKREGIQQTTNQTCLRNPNVLLHQCTSSALRSKSAGPGTIHWPMGSYVGSRMKLCFEASCAVF